MLMLMTCLCFQANTVFDGLNITRDYNGPVVFLEEDHYVSPDFYHVLGQMYDIKKTYVHCQLCSVTLTR